MAIIDTHIHVWDLDMVSYSWLEGNTSLLNKTYALDQLQADKDAVGITGGVLVQAANNAEETDWMLKTAALNPWIMGVVGWVPLLDPDATLRAIEAYKSNPMIKGFRHLIHDERNTKWLLQEPVIESLRILAAHGYTYDVVGTKLDHLKCVLTLSTEVPELKMVLDHLNQPPIPDRKFGEWGQLLEESALNQNLLVKISGLGLTANNADWDADMLKPFISLALAAFGSQRCMLGGDWPVALLAGNYQYTWAQYKTVINTLLNEQDQRHVYELTARAFYGL